MRFKQTENSFFDEAKFASCRIQCKKFGIIDFTFPNYFSFSLFDIVFLNFFYKNMST